MTDWKAFRAQFPALERQVWVNAAATSPLPRPVRQVVGQFWDEVHLHGDRQLPSWLEGVERTRALVAASVGGAPDEVAFTPSTSHSMGLVGSWLRAAGVRRVVTLASEFPASTLPLLHQGFDLHFVEPVGGVYNPAAIEAALAPGDALVASHVQFGLGCALDLPALGAIAAAKGCRFVVNATQSLGARPVDVAAAGADCLVATSHKWLCAGYGVGLLWMRRAHLETHRFPFAGWLSVEHPERMDNRSLPLRGDARVVEVGTYPFDGPLRLGAALELLREVGFEAIHHRIVALTDRLRAGLRCRGLAPLVPDDPAVRSGITSVPVEDPEGLVARLATQGVIASPRRGALRLALHAYNDESDVERTLEALDRCLATR